MARKTSLKDKKTYMNLYQHTLKKSVKCQGIGLHSGRPVDLTISPAETNSGILFKRSDIQDGEAIPAFMNRVVDTQLATTIGDDDVKISTTEHLLAALTGLGIDNALVELNTSEVPIMDGSAGPFVRLLKKTGLKEQKTLRRLIKITREISYQDGDKSVRILPYDGFKVSAEIDFEHSLIKQQTYSFELNSKKFVKEIAPARTFGFLEDVEKLRACGLALGGSLENAVVMDKENVLNKDGLRFDDEFVRHKVLDLVGDLTLLGWPLLGHVVATKSGHGDHLGLMQEIAAHPECWEFVELNQNGQHSVLDKVVSSTKEAGNMLLPILVPPSEPALAEAPCPA